jgi:hypothetical protein
MIDGAAGRLIDDRGYLGVFASGTQQINEFRFGEGVTRGAGLDGWIRFREVTLEGALARYWHTFENRPQFEDYGQWWGRMSLSWAFGRTGGVR